MKITKNVDSCEENIMSELKKELEQTKDNFNNYYKKYNNIKIENLEITAQLNDLNKKYLINLEINKSLEEEKEKLKIKLNEKDIDLEFLNRKLKDIENEMNKKLEEKDEIIKILS